MAIFPGRLEAPSLDRFNRFLVQPHAERSDHADIRGKAVGVYDNAQNASSLIFRLARLFGKLRIRPVNHPRLGCALSHAENTAAHAAARTRSYSRPVS